MDDQKYAGLLRQTMADMTRKFAHPNDIGDTLRSVTTSCVELIDGVDCADVLLISSPDNFRSLAATSQLAVDMDTLQRRFREGPCLDAAIGHATVRCHDLREDVRWPRFADAASAAGVRSMFSFQLFTHDRRMGALNLFGLNAGTFNVESEAIGTMLATHAAIALISDDARLQFKSALASRDIIGQAKGMVMERFDVDAVRAFQLLTSLSQSSNRRVADIAEDLVARGSESRT